MTPPADRSTMAAHLAWLVEPARGSHPRLRLEIACGAPDHGPNIGKTFPLDEIDNAVGFASWANARGFNCYVGVTLKRADTPAKGRTKTEHAALATALAVDIDGGFVGCSRKLMRLAAPALIVRTGATPEPRGQLWFRAVPTDDLAAWDEANRRAVAFSGGDEYALGRYRLMRLAGSVSYPSPAKAARDYTVELTRLLAFPNAPAHDLNDLLARFPPVSNIVPFPKDRRAPAHRSNDEKNIAKSIVQNHYGPLPVNKINTALVHGMMMALPAVYADDYEPWLFTGMALHDFDDGEIGLALWRKFSRRSGKFDDRLMEKWATFAGYDGDPLTIGWLRHEAEAHGWRAPCRWDRETPGARQGAGDGGR
jgi:hypothetical protein